MGDSGREGSARVLLVEDNPADALLVRRAFAQICPNIELHVVQDGPAALEFLRHEGEYSNAPRPTLVLLDLNLPRMSGLEVLAEVRRDKTLRALPVVILTSSEDEHDISQSYDLGANGYVAKRAELSDFVAAMRDLADFWFGAATLPKI